MHQPHSLSQDSLFYTIQDLSHTQDYTMHQPHSLSQDSLFYTILDLSHTQDYTMHQPHSLSPGLTVLYHSGPQSYTGLHHAPASQS
jgi:hypothetical protein